MPKKTQCWERVARGGRKYTVCDGSKGQKGVYTSKKNATETSKQYKARMGVKVKDMTKAQKQRYDMLAKKESRARGKK